MENHIKKGYFVLKCLRCRFVYKMQYTWGLPKYIKEVSRRPVPDELG